MIYNEIEDEDFVEIEVEPAPVTTCGHCYSPQPTPEQRDELDAHDSGHGCQCETCLSLCWGECWLFSPDELQAQRARGLRGAP